MQSTYGCGLGGGRTAARRFEIYANKRVTNSAAKRAKKCTFTTPHTHTLRLTEPDTILFKAHYLQLPPPRPQRLTRSTQRQWRRLPLPPQSVHPHPGAQLDRPGHPDVPSPSGPSAESAQAEASGAPLARASRHMLPGLRCPTTASPHSCHKPATKPAAHPEGPAGRALPGPGPTRARSPRAS